jgi:hypothetical protein
MGGGFAPPRARSAPYKSISQKIKYYFLAKETIQEKRILPKIKYYFLAKET